MCWNFKIEDRQPILILKNTVMEKYPESIDPKDLKDQPISNIVSKNYKAAGILKNYGIDYYRHRDITLKEASKRTGVNADVVADILNKIPQKITETGKKFKEWELDFLIEFIKHTHHRFIRSKTGEIFQYAARVAKLHGHKYPENVEIFDKFSILSTAMAEHLESEEAIVFPLINKIYHQKIKGCNVDDNLLWVLQQELRDMLEEHKEVVLRLKEIRELSNQFTPPPEACATYRILYQTLEAFEIDMHKHIHLENNILFRKSNELIAIQENGLIK